MNVLVDTSVWVDHFHHGRPDLLQELEHDRVLIHPLVLGELACGTPPAPRERTLARIAKLRQPRIVELGSVVGMVEVRQLYGLGCNIIDLSLLNAALLTPNTRLWTLDRRLHRVAERYGRAFPAASH